MNEQARTNPVLLGMLCLHHYYLTHRDLCKIAQQGDRSRVENTVDELGIILLSTLVMLCAYRLPWVRDLHPIWLMQVPEDS